MFAAFFLSGELFPLLLESTAVAPRRYASETIRDVSFLPQHKANSYAPQAAVAPARTA